MDQVCSHKLRIIRVLITVVLLNGLQAKLFPQSYKEISVQSHLSSISNNSGIAVADYDNDHDLDLFIVSRWEYNDENPAVSQLFRNNNDGSFTNVTASSGIGSSHDYTGLATPGTHGFGHKMGASWGDYDNDGYPDLFLSSALFLELYHNNQDGSFSNVTIEAGISQSNYCYNTGALWFDFNNDSYLDLYLTNVFGCAGKLYQNNGDGTFTNISEIVGLNLSGNASWMAIPWDINEDGYQDLYISKDFDQANELWINNGGVSFADEASEYGIEDKWNDGMGLAQSDFNNDGFTDLYITNINESSLYKNSGLDTFSNIAGITNIELTGWAWSCQFADFDHDLDEDLVVVNGYHNNTSNKYYSNQLDQGLEEFINLSEDNGMDKPSKSTGLAVFDYDNDGDLDILMGMTKDNPEFYKNQLLESSLELSKNWLQIELEGTTSNRDAIGTIVKLVSGDMEMIRHYHGATLFAQNQLPLHFGLAEFTEIDQLIIMWPSGLTEQHTNIPINSFIHATEGSGYEVLSLGAIKIPGCTDPYSCDYNPDATLDDGSCNTPDAEIITGNSTAGILSEQVYSFSPINQGSFYKWSIQNGTIIDGQGEASVTVKWGIADEGKISAIEFHECYGARVSKDVLLSAEDAPENVSVARMWNEVLLEAIRRDYARPTVHARNLFHTSAAMYDAWALFHDEADTYLTGKKLHDYSRDFQGFETDVEKNPAMETAISYAAYSLLNHRFKDSPHADETLEKIKVLMNLLNYDPAYTSSDYSGGNPAALGNYIGQSFMYYGLNDGSNEFEKYENSYYSPANEPLIPHLPGNPSILDPNRWQPLQLEIYIDQSGNLLSGTTPEFLSPEWGNVYPFALAGEDANKYTRDGDEYIVYLDPGSPPFINGSSLTDTDLDLYKWNFALVAIWSSHLNPFDGVMLDISPGSIGDIEFNMLPSEKENYGAFYDLFEGGDIGLGRSMNPYTGEPYESHIVPRGDYTRILAEFWADGPDSETPPGHWFVLLNYINDHEDFKRKFKGEGEIMSPLEWDVKAYFTLGGAMQDAAIAAWGVKGWYDYIRPISAIRYMADKGQSTNQQLDNYHPDGIPLFDGYIELVEDGDELAGGVNENVGKLKVFCWKGHDYVDDPSSDQAGVGWILAENWWPYQRPSFVTPPFAGYVSGHSTYSRAAAEAITLLTGSEYFPGGLGEFVARKNEFLVFEEGPSQDVVLQWATYRDASDQCSLSRIWGGIHPPADDIPGRIMGDIIGKEAFTLAEAYFNSEVSIDQTDFGSSLIYPVPTHDNTIYIASTREGQIFKVYDLRGARVPVEKIDYYDYRNTTKISFTNIEAGLYFIRSDQGTWKFIVD